MSSRTIFHISFTVLCLTLLVLTPTLARDFDTSSGDITNTETFTGSEQMNVSGGKTLYLGGTGSGAFTGDWHVASGTTLATDNTASSKETSGDDVLGSGKVYLDGATLMMWNHDEKKSSLVYERGISNDLVLSGNCTFKGSVYATELFLLGNLSGSGTITEQMGYSFRIKGDNSAYTGNWDLQTDWAWVQNGETDSTKAFGSGSVKLTSSGLGTPDNFVMSNDLEVASSLTNTFQGANTMTISGKLTGSGNITVQTVTGGTSGTSYIKMYGDGSAYTGNWNISGVKATDGTITWRTIETNNNDSNGKQTVDSTFGSGTLNLNYASLAVAKSAHPGRISNNIVVTNAAQIGLQNAETNIYGNISGSGTIYRKGGWCVRLRGDNSNFTGNWSLDGDWTNVSVSTESGNDKSFGSGTVILNGGSVTTAKDMTLTANFQLNKYNAHGIPFQGSGSLTLKGKLTGSKDFTTTAIVQSDGKQASTPSVYNIQGDGSEYTGNWYIDSGKTLATNNTSIPSDTTKDPRFGSGTIYLRGGSLNAAGSGKTNVVMNAINVTADSSILTSGHELAIYGNISGTGNLTRPSDTGSYTFYLYGDNSNFSGNWYVNRDVIATSHNSPEGYTKGVDKSFGSGTLYLSSTGLRNAGEIAYVDNSVNVSGGSFLRYGNGFVFRGDVTLVNNASLTSQTSYAEPPVSFSGEDALLQGTGTVNAVTTMKSGSTLNPGTTTTGKLTVSNLTFEDGSQLVIDVTSAEMYDVLNVSSSLLFEEGSQIDVKVNGSLYDLVGKELKVVTSSSTLPDLTRYFTDSTRAIFDEAYMSGNSLILKTTMNGVPEPAAWVLLLLGTVLLVWKGSKRYSL